METEIRWECSICNEKFISEELLPICPKCGADEDDIIGLELE